MRGLGAPVWNSQLWPSSHSVGASTVTPPSARDLTKVMCEVTGQRYRLLRAGSLRRLERLINITRAIVPDRGELYPPWQGMQYMHNMFSGLAKHEQLDNDRYPGMRWTTARDVLNRSR